MSFPTTLDTLTTGIGTTGQPLSNPNHITQHNAECTAIQALEAKVGADSSAVATSLDYLLRHTKTSYLTSDDAGVFMPTGAVIPFAGSSAPTGFYLTDGSLKNRTTDAALFAVIGTTYGAGDGSTTFALPDMRSRTVLGVGTGTKALTFVSRSSNTITISGSENSTTNDVQTGQIFKYHSTSTIITGLTNDTNYYLIRIAYNQIQLATTLANAQAGTAISLSSDGGGTQTFTSTLTARALADTGGEESHAMSSTELLIHTHTMPGTGGGAGASLTTGSASGTVNTGSAGGNAAMNIMNPFLALNYIIKK